MADPNKIRIDPANYNNIVITGNSIHLEEDPFIPPGWKPPANPIGGSDVKAVLDDPQTTTG